MAYRTTCPGCGEEGYLEVVSGYFLAMGMTLEEEGFSFCDAKQVDTEEEVVRCWRCGWTGGLAELDDDTTEDE